MLVLHFYCIFAMHTLLNTNFNYKLIIRLANIYDIFHRWNMYRSLSYQIVFVHIIDNGGREIRFQDTNIFYTR